MAAPVWVFEAMGQNRKIDRRLCDMLTYTIITPTFNRRGVIVRSIESSLAFIRVVRNAELIVIDDASRDGTVELLYGRYADEIARGVMTLRVRSTNGGVTAARNDGITAAQGDWLIFIDSDDQLLPVAALEIPAFVQQRPDAPVLFFRCEDEQGRLIGPPTASESLDLATLLTRGTPGECMPVVARSSLIDRPFDDNLRGHELLGYLRIVAARGPAMVSNTVVRRYGTARMDRLSLRGARLQRASVMALGYTEMMREFGHLLPLRRRLALAARIGFYKIASILK
jgi:glycosyltransferase involved in cell wall biosynthesis